MLPVYPTQTILGVDTRQYPSAAFNTYLSRPVRELAKAEEAVLLIDMR
jgi:hypothetical protein